MARWLFTEANYLPQSNNWQEKPPEGRPTAASDRNFWLSEICETMENRAGWELVQLRGSRVWQFIICSSESRARRSPIRGVDF
jgi:gluconate kinase